MCSINVKFASSSKYQTLFSNEFESAIADAFQEQEGQKIDKVTLDFTDLIYVDVVTLPNISSFVQSFLEDKSKTVKIKLPNNPKVLTFLKTWDFTDSFFYSTKKERELKDCLDDASHDLSKLFFSNSEEDVSVLDEFTGNCLDDQNLNELLKGLITKHNPYGSLENSNAFERYNRWKNFFGVFSFDVLKKNNGDDISQNKSIVFEERKRWQQINEIESILDNVLKDRNGKECKGYIPNKVIWECVSNALRHPEGDLIQTTSRFINKKSRPFLKSNHFTLAFWDNGESMIETLRRAYQDTGNIKANLPERIHYPIFEVSTDEFNSISVDTKILPGEFYLKNDSYDYYWFLSTFFPGVTRDPNPDGSFANQSSEGTIFKYPGMGLYLLLKTVVDTFNGTIIVRTGNYRLRISASTKSGCHYKADIKKVKSFSSKGFKGNLLSIHLPLYEKSKPLTQLQ